MITALQHFISKKGKFVFILLLLLVVVSFVLYLSQGSSVFDLMSDGGREKKNSLVTIGTTRIKGAFSM